IVANMPENNNNKYIGTIPTICPPQLFSLVGFRYRVKSALFTAPVSKIPTAAVIPAKKGIPQVPPLVALLNNSLPPTDIYLEIKYTRNPNTIMDNDELNHFAVSMP